MNLKSLTLATSLFAISLCADDEGRMRNIENRLTSLEDSQNNNCCIINPSARPFPEECWGFYVSVDPIIWQAQVNGLPVAVQNDGTGYQHVRNFSFDWDWGVRVGIGLNTDHDGWDIVLRWTHWNNDGRRNLSGASFPSQGNPAILPSVTDEVQANWELHYNILDLENGRQFYVSKCLTLRPFAGLRTAWIKQEANFNYAPPLVNKEDRTWGIGIRGGVDMQWGLGAGFSLFSNYAGNLLYSYHSVKQKESNQTVGDFYHVGNAIFEMQIGLGYDWFSCDCCYHLGFDLGWELHFHPGQNQFLNFYSSEDQGKFFANQGDLGIQGYFLNVRFDF